LSLLSCYNSNSKSASETIYNVTDFGAVGDSVTINTVAIQKAIDQCYHDKGGVVLIRDGVFSSGALFLKEGVQLKIAKGAKLRAVEGLSNYPDLNNTRIAGIEMRWPCAFINAIDTKNVKISGEGTIDGSGYYWWEKYWIRRDSLLDKIASDLIDWYVPRPRLILFQNVSDSGIEGVRLRNSAFWTVHICYSQSIKISGIEVYNPVLPAGKKAASSDGIDVDSSSDIFISNSSISCDDDCIAVKSGRGSDGLRVNKPTYNVSITNCLFKAGHGGVSIGTETAGGIKNIWIANCKADGNKAPIKFKPRPGRGGVIENIVHENWEIKNVETVIDYSLREVDGDDYIDEWQKIKVPFEKATPHYRNITIRNVKATKSDKSISFLGWPLAHIDNLYLENIDVNSSKNGRFQYIDNLIMKNVRIKSKNGEMEFKEVSNKTRY
jgi:polygalacturonase